MTRGSGQDVEHEWLLYVHGMHLGRGPKACDSSGKSTKNQTEKARFWLAKPGHRGRKPLFFMGFGGYFYCQKVFTVVNLTPLGSVIRCKIHFGTSTENTTGDAPKSRISQDFSKTARVLSSEPRYFLFSRCFTDRCQILLQSTATLRCLKSHGVFDVSIRRMASSSKRP